MVSSAVAHFSVSGACAVSISTAPRLRMASEPSVVMPIRTAGTPCAAATPPPSPHRSSIPRATGLHDTATTRPQIAVQLRFHPTPAERTLRQSPGELLSLTSCADSAPLKPSRAPPCTRFHLHVELRRQAPHAPHHLLGVLRPAHAQLVRLPSPRSHTPAGAAERGAHRLASPATPPRPYRRRKIASPSVRYTGSRCRP